MTAKDRKPVSAATRALLDQMTQDAAPKGDKLERARDLVKQLRDEHVKAAALVERLTAVKQEIRTLEDKTIPDFFDEAGVPGINYKSVEIFQDRKIVVRKTGVGIKAAIDETGALTGAQKAKLQVRTRSWRWPTNQVVVTSTFGNRGKADN